MHGKAQYFISSFFRFGEVSIIVPKMFKYRLFMKTLRVVHSNLNSGFFHGGHNLIPPALIHADGILGVVVGVAITVAAELVGRKEGGISVNTAVTTTSRITTTELIQENGTLITSSPFFYLLRYETIRTGL